MPRRLFPVLLLLLFLMVACIVPVAAPTAVPTATPTRPAPTPLPTRTPSPVPSLTPTGFPNPVLPLAPAGAGGKTALLWHVFYPSVEAEPRLQAARLDDQARRMPLSRFIELGLAQTYPGPRLAGLAAAPDGKRAIVTLVGRDVPVLYLLDLQSGARQRLLADQPPAAFLAWTPDGKNALFVTSPGDPRPVLVELASGKQSFLPLPTAGSDLPSAAALSFSPGGRWLADALVYPPTQVRSQGFVEIGIRQGLDGRRSTLCRVPDGSRVVADSLAWSSAGTHLAFVAGVNQQAQLWIADVAAGRCKSLLVLSNSGYFDRSPAWSPDGRWIAAVRAGRLQDGEIYETDLLLVDPNTGKAELLPGGAVLEAPPGEVPSALVGGWGASSLQWSPDGAWLGFVRSFGPFGEVRAVNLASRKVVALAGPTPPLAPILWLGE